MKATIVLDCCHSGSATRGSGRVRFHGLPQTCQSTEADESLLTFMNKLLKHDIEKEHEELHEGSVLKDAVLLLPQCHTLLAACQPRHRSLSTEI